GSNRGRINGPEVVHAHGDEGAREFPPARPGAAGALYPDRNDDGTAGEGKAGHAGLEGEQPLADVPRALWEDADHAPGPQEFERGAIGGDIRMRRRVDRSRPEFPDEAAEPLNVEQTHPGHVEHDAGERDRNRGGIEVAL